MSHQPPEPPALPPGSSDPHRRGSHNSRSRPQNALKRTVVRPVGPTPDPIDAAFVANRLTSLTHELANLLDGSLRVVSLARRTLDRADKPGEAPGVATAESILGEIDRRLGTLHAAMAQMAELVRASMMGLSGIVTGVRLPFGASSSLTDAVTHAVEVMRPLAEDRCIRLDLSLASELNGLAAGPIYTVVVNGVRNAIEAIERRGSSVGGVVSVRGRVETGSTGRAIVLEISDDGIGPPRPQATDSQAVFRPGFTTKQGGYGIGLSMSLDVVHQLGGSIQLLPRTPGNGERGTGTGAVLRVCYPVTAKIDDGASAPSPAAE